MADHDGDRLLALRCMGTVSARSTLPESIRMAQSISGCFNFNPTAHGGESESADWSSRRNDRERFRLSGAGSNLERSTSSVSTGNAPCSFSLSKDFFEQLLAWARRSESALELRSARRCPIWMSSSPKLGAKIDNQIEDLGENQRVNDMTGNLNDAPRHRNLSTTIIVLAGAANAT